MEQARATSRDGATSQDHGPGNARPPSAPSKDKYKDDVASDLSDDDYKGSYNTKLKLTKYGHPDHDTWVFATRAVVTQTLTHLCRFVPGMKPSNEQWGDVRKMMNVDEYGPSERARRVRDQNGTLFSAIVTSLVDNGNTESMRLLKKIETDVTFGDGVGAFITIDNESGAKHKKTNSMQKIITLRVKGRDLVRHVRPFLTEFAKLRAHAGGGITDELAIELIKRELGSTVPEVFAAIRLADMQPSCDKIIMLIESVVEDHLARVGYAHNESAHAGFDVDDHQHKECCGYCQRTRGKKLSHAESACKNKKYDASKNAAKNGDHPTERPPSAPTGKGRGKGGGGWCNYGPNCTRKDCWYKHPSQNGSTEGTATDTARMTREPPSALAQMPVETVSSVIGAIHQRLENTLAPKEKGHTAKDDRKRARTDDDDVDTDDENDVDRRLAEAAESLARLKIEPTPKPKCEAVNKTNNKQCKNNCMKGLKYCHIHAQAQVRKGAKDQDLLADRGHVAHNHDFDNQSRFVTLDGQRAHRIMVDSGSSRANGDWSTAGAPTGRTGACSTASGLKHVEYAEQGAVFPFKELDDAEMMVVDGPPCFSPGRAIENAPIDHELAFCMLKGKRVLVRDPATIAAMRSAIDHDASAYECELDNFTPVLYTTDDGTLVSPKHIQPGFDEFTRVAHQIADGIIDDCARLGYGQRGIAAAIAIFEQIKHGPGQVSQVTTPIAHTPTTLNLDSLPSVTKELIFKTVEDAVDEELAKSPEPSSTKALIVKTVDDELMSMLYPRSVAHKTDNVDRRVDPPIDGSSDSKIDTPTATLELHVDDTQLESDRPSQTHHIMADRPPSALVFDTNNDQPPSALVPDNEIDRPPSALVFDAENDRPPSALVPDNDIDRPPSALVAHDNIEDESARPARVVDDPGFKVAWAKQAAHPKGTAPRAEQLGGRIGMDSIGPIDAGVDPELRLHRFATIAYDDHTRHIWGYPRKKLDARTTMPIIDDIATELQIKDSRWLRARIDPGVEFKGEVRDKLRDLHVFIEETIADEHSGHGRLEGRGGAIQAGTRADLQRAVLKPTLAPTPLSDAITTLWPMAMNCHIWWENNCGQHAHLFNPAVDVDSHLKFLFGQRVTYVPHKSTLDNMKKQRFHARARAGIFVYYWPSSPTSYLIVDEAKLLQGSWHAVQTRAVNHVLDGGVPIFPLRDLTTPQTKNVVELMHALRRGRRTIAHAHNLCDLPLADRPHGGAEADSHLKDATNLLVDMGALDPLDNMGAYPLDDMGASHELAHFHNDLGHTAALGAVHFPEYSHLLHEFENAHVTKLLKRSDDLFSSDLAVAARHKECQKVSHKFQCFDWSQIKSWPDDYVNSPALIDPNIWAPSIITTMMLTSIKHFQKLASEWTFKGRLVACTQKNIRGEPHSGIDSSMFSLPVSEVEFRCALFIGGVLAFQHNEPDGRTQLTPAELSFVHEHIPDIAHLIDDKGRLPVYIAIQSDEENAYIACAMQNGEHEPVVVNLRSMTKDVRASLVPPETLHEIETMIKAGLTPCAPVVNPLYGMRRASFDYEHNRDGRFDQHHIKKITPGVFNHACRVDSDSQQIVHCDFDANSADGPVYRACVCTQVDDHLFSGHAHAVIHAIMSLVLSKVNPIKYGLISALSEYNGITVQYTTHALGIQWNLDQKEYGMYWIRQLEEYLHKNISCRAAPGAPPQVLDNEADVERGILADEAPRFLMAAFYAARLTVLQNLFPTTSLSTQLTHWTKDADRRLIHLYGAWKKQLLGDEYTLSLIFDRRDANDLIFAAATDSDHASCPLTRRSVSGSCCQVLGDHGTRATLSAACKNQSAITTSSGAAEVCAADDLLELPQWNDHEKAEFIKQRCVASKFQSTAMTLRRAVIPALDLLEAFDVPFKDKLMCVDASVAVTALSTGWSTLLKHLDRTMGVNLGFVAETLRKLGMTVKKIGTAENPADTFTKALARETLTPLLVMLGIGKHPSPSNAPKEQYAPCAHDTNECTQCRSYCSDTDYQ